MKSAYCRIFAVLFFLFAMLVFACDKDDNEDPALTCDQAGDELNTYNQRIASILDQSCAVSSCHTDVSMANGFSLEGYENAKQVFQTQDVICAINHGGGCEPMPKGGAKLGTETIRQLTCWKQNNYPL